VQNLVGIDSAVTNLSMREKTRFVWIFLSLITGTVVVCDCRSFSDSNVSQGSVAMHNEVR